LDEVFDKMDRKAQSIMGLPFVFIVSIIVSVVVIVVAIYAINVFVERGEQAKVVSFVTSLRGRVEDVYYMTSGSQISFRSELPLDVERVCFSDGNVRFEPFNVLNELGLDDEFKVAYLKGSGCVSARGFKVWLRNEGEYVRVVI